MKRADATEAAALVDRMLMVLVGIVPPQGRAGAAARTIIGDTRTYAFKLLIDDAMGRPLDQCFLQARLAGSTLAAIETVREQVAQEQPLTLGGKLLQNAGIRLCLATQSSIIARMNFVSRQDVDLLKQQMLQPFRDAEEIAADDMDQMTFQALIKLHGAVTAHLVSTAQPLPRMVNFRFYESLPSLVMAYRLYDDASRCDELRQENKVVHPAFCPPTGQALSS